MFSLRMISAEREGEKRFGINTIRFKRSGSADFFHYQGASYLVLDGIFDELENYGDFHFIDIGSGKGRVAFVAESRGFKNITGIELDKSLYDQSLQNLATHRQKCSETRIRFLNENAVDHHYEDHKTVYFLFNPFSGRILEQLLIRILAETRNDVVFVYMNPRFAGVFNKMGLMPEKKIKTRFYTEALIYKRRQRSS
jgi:16S rRNA G966 N2-methylase RsmD